MKIKPGDVFGKLTVMYRCEENKWGKPVWHCKCSCSKGTELDVPDVSLKRGNKTNCGCEPKIYKDLRGKKYGKLTVIDIDHRTEDGRTYWKCICDCGKYSLEKDEYFIADQHSLVTNKCVSCGCERGNKLQHNLKGKVFGTLNVVGHERGKGWKCECTNCGKITYHDTTHLEGGLVKGDGCLPKYEDFAGKTIGKLYVKKIDHRNTNGVIYWLCDCACGNKNVVKPSYYLRDTKSVVMRSCGCEDAITNKKYIEYDLVGKQFNNWLVLERAGKSPITGKSLWKCRCTNCNKTERIVVGNNLISGTSKSCGCSISCYVNELEAAYAYNLWAKEHFKEFAYLNNFTEDELKELQMLLPLKTLGDRKNEKKTSKYKYISYCKDKTCWCYSRMLNKVYYRKKGFKTEEEAHDAYIERMKEIGVEP